ncbi:MAG: aldehyde dehydrogenase family protein [Leptospiraceae bacterium]|nr:aldehyde dehydrogenase family protein [Leptospiraceae bacterium]MDW8306902.1 aldehyde dehydrogenase family protein [Leptospiraceae bacterium]
MKDFPLFCANERVYTDEKITVYDKYSNEIIGKACVADRAILEQAISWGKQAQEPLRELSSYERRDVIFHIMTELQRRCEEFTTLIVQETGKTLLEARTEVSRAIDTFRVAMEESTRLYGEILPLDIAPRSRNYTGYTKRIPVGLCFFITPFNFPLNLLAHKVAPALATGCPFIAKPASTTPLSALLLGEIMAQTQLPKGAFSILPTSAALAEEALLDPRIQLVSFTGSAEVGWKLKQKAYRKKVILELGGNAAIIVTPSANILRAAQRITFGAFYQAGQSCISVQRIFVHEDIYTPFIQELLTQTRQLKLGNPMEEDTHVGPLISEKEAMRIESWIQKAQEKGARLLCGGKRQGSFLEPTLLENVPPDEPLVCEEAFGPVAVIEPFNNLEEAISKVNQSRYGLQAGIFTEKISEALYAWKNLVVGGVVVNDVPSFRVDNMPYGGVKDSGFGREGIRYAMEEMTEIRLMVLSEQ